MNPEWATVWAALAAMGSFLTSALVAASGWRRRRRESLHAQLEQVSAWLHQEPRTGDKHLIVSNASPVPVYGVIVSVVLVQGAGVHRGEDLPGGGHFQRWVPMVPPGQWRVSPSPMLDGGMHRVPGIELGMTDAAGQHWIRRVDGRQYAAGPLSSAYLLRHGAAVADLRDPALPVRRCSSLLSLDLLASYK